MLVLNIYVPSFRDAFRGEFLRFWKLQNLEDHHPKIYKPINKTRDHLVFCSTDTSRINGYREGVSNTKLML